MRDYSKKLRNGVDDCVYSLDEWAACNGPVCNTKNGFGFWAKDGFASEDNVFTTPPEDATHVIWYPIVATTGIIEEDDDDFLPSYSY